MPCFIRDSFVGRTLYHLSGHKLFPYPEEQADYVLPEKYISKEYTATKSDLEVKDEISGSDSSNITMTDDIIVVGWDGEDDPENPRNWPLYEKSIFTIEIVFLTMAVYIGSAIYTPGTEQVMEKMHVGNVVATLPLSLFVIGYGIGALWFSPMQENAYFGRTSVYIGTLFLFFILQIPTALVNNIAGLCILRFLAGIFASPALATGGASTTDVLHMPWMPVGLGCWSMGAVAGPSFGPLIGSAMTLAWGWRGTFWFMAIISGAALLILSFLLPETFEQTILKRKAQRIRKLTGNPNIKSLGEIENEKKSFKDFAVEIAWRPFEITFVEPVVLAIDLYIALVYAILYLWFEAFPIVFVGLFNFTMVTNGASFLSVITGIVIAAIVYLGVIYEVFTKKLLAGQTVEPEIFLPIAIVGAVLMPVGVFIFGWTSAADLHWIGPMIGAAIFAAGAFLIFQTLFNYLGASFKQEYVASVFASNDFIRSTIAGVFPLFARPLFLNLKTDRFPVGWGSSVLGFISVAMILVPIVLYKMGPKLRARSKFANSY